MHKIHKKYFARGFSLLEISIVLLIISTLIGAGITIFNNSVEQQQIDVTKERQRLIQKALLDYRQVFHHIPCPADITAETTASDFGRGEVAFTGVTTCDTGASGYVPTYDIGAGFWGGGVPVRTLKLPDEYAFDGWGNRFLYLMDEDMAKRRAFETIPLDAGAGNMRVQDNTNTSVTTEGVYVLISHGKNGHGARSRGGQVVSASSSNANEQLNCGCDSSAAFTGFGATFVFGPFYTDPSDTTDTFDDILVYGTRVTMPALDEVQP